MSIKIKDIKKSSSNIEGTNSPIPPINLVSPTHKATSIDLKWELASNDVRVKQYVIYRDNIEIKKVLADKTFYTDEGLKGETSYHYFVKAEDTTGMLSEPSNTIKATTKSDIVNTFKVMTHNLYFLPTPSNVGQKLRAKYTITPSSYYKNSDVVILQELFEDKARFALFKGMKKQGGFNYHTPVLGEKAFDFLNGGVAIISKWPITEYKEYIFQNKGCGMEFFQSKGVMYAKIDIKGTNVHVFGTHTQSEFSMLGCNGPSVRKKQIQELQNFVEKQNISPEEYVIIGGDFNVNRHDVESYNYLINTLDIKEPNYVGHSYTWDSKTNLYAKEIDADTKRSYLDYIFLSKSNLLPSEGIYMNTAQMVKVNSQECGPECRELLEMDCKFLDFSDHYPVMTVLPIHLKKGEPPAN